MSRTDTAIREPESPLREYLSIIRVRKWSVLLVTALTVVAAVFYSYRQGPTYQSDAQVLVRPASVVSVSGASDLFNDQFAGGQLINMDTEMELAGSEEVAALAAHNLGTNSSPEALLKGLSVDRTKNTEILTLTYTHSDPAIPKRAVQAFAEGYLEFRRRQLEGDMVVAVEALNRRIRDTSRQLRRAERRLTRAASIERPTAQGQVDLLTERLDTLQQQRNELSDPDALRVGQVVQPAADPVASNPSPVRSGVLGLLVGLVLGVGVALLRERLDDRLRGQEDLETHAQAPVLAAVPRVPTWRKQEETKVVMLAEPTSPAAEAYRTLRTSVLFTASQAGSKILLVTSPNPGEGKTATTANLGVALAETGRRVMLISADLRRPRLHSFFGVDNAVGLTNVLTGDKRPLDAVAWAGDGKVPLPLLPSGPLPGNPGELLASDPMEKLVTRLSQVAEFVLIDVGPILAVADAMTLVPLTDGVLLVADAHGTTRGAVDQARHQLEQVNARVIGTVLNRFDPAQARGRGYYYGYYSSYQQTRGTSGTGDGVRARKWLV